MNNNQPDRLSNTYENTIKEESKQAQFPISNVIRNNHCKNLVVQHNRVIDSDYRECCKVSSFKYVQNPRMRVESPLAEVMFKGNRLAIYKNENNYPIHDGEIVIVEVENGMDIATICSVSNHAVERHKSSYGSKPVKYRIIRHARPDDLAQLRLNWADESKAAQFARSLLTQFNLDIKVTEAEWQFDRQRLTVFFTAPQRVDFREFVKELARQFKTRIELRQISAREETKRLGDSVGCCGLNLCCTSFLNEFCHVTLDHAKTQQLSGNVAKLSGNCGRLKCCLLFEYESYSKSLEKYPALNSRIETNQGMAKILKIDVFKDTLNLYIPDKQKYITLTYDELQEYVVGGKVFRPLEEDLKNQFVIEDIAQLVDDNF
ncbi:MAG: regulatory iron-sulfur-containing complex subunit RicT [Candidatus Kapabacteria bacterium]|nr:regulatory iron-sulfur-containing complex subunit RicT [Candidatus Kapabacteria bacterium]